MLAALKGNLKLPNACWTAALPSTGPAGRRCTTLPRGPEPAGGLLLERGAQVDAPSPNGSTALMMAARYGSDDSALMLLARGCQHLGAQPEGHECGGLCALGGARCAGRQTDSRNHGERCQAGAHSVSEIIRHGLWWAADYKKPRARP
jgi:ankyrin repeat protein